MLPRGATLCEIADGKDTRRKMNLFSGYRPVEVVDVLRRGRYLTRARSSTQRHLGGQCAKAFPPGIFHAFWMTRRCYPISTPKKKKMDLSSSWRLVGGFVIVALGNHHHPDHSRGTTFPRPQLLSLPPLASSGRWENLYLYARTSDPETLGGHPHQD